MGARQVGFATGIVFASGPEALEARRVYEDRSCPCCPTPYNPEFDSSLATLR